MRNRISLSALAAMTLLAACSTDKSAGDGGGTVIVSMGSDAASLFPLLVADETGKAITDLLFDHLIEIPDAMATTNDAAWEPRLARSWDWSPDSLTVAFHIDPAARFHDGAPVRASDVRYSFRLLVDSVVGAQTAPLLANIDSVSIVDSMTPKFWFKKHLPEQLYDVAYQVPIVPEHVYGKVAPADMKTSDVLRTPVGSGRFRFAKWEPGVRIELVADTANYRGRAKLDRVVFMLGVPPTAAPTAVLTGESDFYSAFPIDQAATLDSSTVARGMPYRQMGYGMLGLSPLARKSASRPHPVMELPVRRAISMALDREGMLTNVFNKAGITSYGPFPASAATADTTIRIPAYDTTAAKALLDSAGWKVGPNGIRQKNGRPLSFELMVPNSSAIRMRFAELIQEQLRRVGVQVEVDKLAFPAFMGRLQTGDFDGVLQTVNTDPSAGGAKQYWATEGIAGHSNFLRYSNPRVDALLDSATRAQEQAVVKRYASRAYQAIADDAPAVWLYTASTLAAVNRRIETQPFRADGWWAHLADWSIPADKRIARDNIGLRPGTP
jgi:peptide/nickel transport system substrate-binding protein